MNFEAGSYNLIALFFVNKLNNFSIHGLHEFSLILFESFVKFVEKLFAILGGKSKTSFLNFFPVGLDHELYQVFKLGLWFPA